ncbi:hypothetical protein HNP38_002704 [Chryseobacterium defluvii]|uniref:Uncharacterized protein n=1 Tax=Chryseobacterium defluvii TaxID=160396 RepID=A0A840KIS6_9FLAO|nr:hypothetical protein [Chryseobacterium defluvii]MBB4807400.1 hypothetical protein [Chryseobacterium defluvii]
MSDFENIVEFLRLHRRSEEAEKNALSPTDVLFNSLEDNESYHVNKNSFETDFTKYKRIIGILEYHNAESIYLLKTGTERKYFVKTAYGKYQNLLDESIVILNEEWLIELPIEFAKYSYIYDTEKNIVVIVAETLKEVFIFPDQIYYDPKGKYLIDIGSDTYTYDYEDHVTTFGKIVKVLFEDESYLWNNPEKKVQVLKSEKEGKINLIPFMQVEYGLGNFILKYLYYEKDYRPKFFLPDDQCALVLKFKGIGGLLTFLDQTLFKEGFSLEKGENENVLRDYFRDQFMKQIIHTIEDNLKNKSTFAYYDAMKTLFYLPESVAVMFSDDFFWMLLEMAISRDSLTNKTDLAEENIFVKLIRVILQKEGLEVKLMNWLLERIKDGDQNITKFEYIYDRINGDNFLEFAKLIAQAWKKSRFIYPDTEKNPEFATTDGPLFLPYKSGKTLGFYFSNVSMSFETHSQKGRLLKTEYETGKTQKVDKVEAKTGTVYQVDEEIVNLFWYHPFHPVYLKDIQNQETSMKLDSIVPAFMLKANRDKQFWSNVITAGEYALDVVTTLSGVGNIAKFRYLAKFAAKAGKLRFVSEAGRTVVAARKAVVATAAVVEITSGTVNALLKLTGVRDTEWGKSISEYLFWLELLSLSGELTVAVHNGLRKSAKEILEHEDDLRKTAKNADEAKQIDELLEELRKVAEEAGDYSARFAKKASKSLDNVSSKIKNYESKIQRYDYETGMLVNNAKKIEIKDVTQKAKSQISWRHISDEKFVSSTITHNHPSGSGLSLADIKMFIGTRLNEIRAVTPEGTVYSMKNKGISEKKVSDLLEKIEDQEKFAEATFPNASQYIDAYVFRIIWDDIKDLVDYVHYAD